jgi:hypothetical protein
MEWCITCSNRQTSNIDNFTLAGMAYWRNWQQIGFVMKNAARMQLGRNYAEIALKSALE